MGVGVGACAVTGHLPVSTRSRLRVIKVVWRQPIAGVTCPRRRGGVSAAQV